MASCSYRVMIWVTKPMGNKDAPSKLPKAKTLAEKGLLLEKVFDPACFQALPVLASKVMSFIGNFSALDFELERATMVAIGGGQDFVEALASGMSSLDYAHRRTAIRGMLKKKAGMSVSALDELFSGMNEARNLRNSFAHGLWCTHPGAPKALVLIKSHSALLQWGVALDALRGERTRKALFDFISQISRSGEPLPSQFLEAFEKLSQCMQSPWDVAFGMQANAAREVEATKQKKWFERNPELKIDWSKVVRADAQLAPAKSELLAMGADAHSDAEIWGKNELNQANEFLGRLKAQAASITQTLLRAMLANRAD